MSRRSRNRKKEALAQQPAPREPRRAWEPRVWALAAAVVVFLAFAPALANGFVDWDDPGLLLENPHWRGLGPEQVRWMFSTSHYGHYQPLTWLTYGLDYVLWGLDPAGYHLTNNVLHALNTLLAYFVCLGLLRRAHEGEAAPPGPSLLCAGAFIASLLFGLHPLRVESVAWVTERRDLVSASFLLLTVLAYVVAVNTGARHRRRRLIAAVMLYACSMLGKVGGAPLPVVLLVLDWYPLRRIPLMPGEWRLAGLLRLCVEKAPFFVIAVGFSIATLLQQTGRWLYPLAEHGLLARCAQAVFGLHFYVFKTLVPLGLMPVYELRPPLDLLEPRFLAAYVLVAAVIAAAVLLARRGRPAVAAAWLCQAAMVGPLLGFFQNGPQLVADRYSYLSTLGWAVLAAAGLIAALRKVPNRAAAAAAVVAAAAVLLGLAALSVRQIGVWRSTASLWSSAYAGDPASSIANNGYGYVLLTAGRTAESVPHFREAVRIEPRNREAWQNLWDALGRLGDGEARREALVAATASPRADVRGEAHYLLGNDLLAQQRNSEAAVHLEASLAAVEASAAAHSNLALVLVRLGRLDEAVSHYRRAIVLDRTLATARDGLARTLALQGRPDEAIAVLETLLAEQPGYAPARSRLEELRRRRGH